MTVNRMCKGDFSKKILIEIIQLEGESKIIGSCMVSLLQLRKNSNFTTNIHLSENSIGTLSLVSFKLLEKKSFFQHMNAGIEISPIYAIDFSGNNGHSIAELENNRFLNPISRLQKTLQFYTTDPLYPVFGLNALFPSMVQPSHYFSLTGNIFQPEILNFQIVQEYYKSILSSIKCTGPAIFAELFDNVYEYVTFDANEGKRYYCFLVMCGQDAEDQEDLKDSLAKLMDLPISVIFFGVFPEVIGYPILKNISENINHNSKREFVNFISSESVDSGFSIESILSTLSAQLLQYGAYKGVIVKTKIENKILRATTLTTKILPKIYQNKNKYFAKCRKDFIEHLKKKGYTKQQIEEVNQVGIPYINYYNLETGTPLPFASVRSKTVKNTLSKLSSVLCSNCRKIVAKFGTLPCGCMLLCQSCVETVKCPKCQEQ